MMAVSAEQQVIAAVDLGTNKVAAFIARASSPERIELLGLGKTESTGIKRGVIVDMGATARAVERAVQAAQRMSGIEIQRVFTNLSGTHVSARNSEGSVAISDGVVDKVEVDGVMEVAKAVPLDGGRVPLHALPQEYCIDVQRGIRDPLGMSGNRLEVKVHVVTCEANAVNNLRRCIESTGLECGGTVLSPLASGAAVLGRDERELGVCLVDMGGGTTDIVVYLDGAIQFSCVLPMAGDSVTKDIAIAFRTPVQNAEELKVNYGCALQELVQESEVVKVPGVGRRSATQLSRYVLADVVGSRYRELLEAIQHTLEEANIDLSRLASGVVLTGGAANLEGIVELAEEVLHIPVALGLPSRLQGLEDIVQSPSYSTGAGLLVFGCGDDAAESRGNGILDGRWRGGLQRWAGRLRRLQG